MFYRALTRVYFHWVAGGFGDGFCRRATIKAEPGVNPNDLTFHVGDRAVPAESLARTLTVRPESASILYVGDSFRVRQTLSVPVHEPGAIILLDIETEQPLEVEVAFTAIPVGSRP